MAEGLYNGNVFNMITHPMVMNMVQNATTLSRARSSEQLLDPRRSIDDECGYKDTSSIGSEDYRLLYDRESVATRTVQVLPMECWKFEPKVVEDEDAEVETEFEKAWDELGQSLLDGSKFKGEEGNILWEYLLRSDVLSGIGTYGCLLLGLDDGEEDLSREAKNKKNQKLTFLRPFDETLAPITRYEEDQLNKRFGQPLQYNVTFNAPDSRGGGAAGVGTTTMEVHWSRIVHVADNLGSSEVFGIPRMQSVYNRLIDLRKLYGGSAEMYWRGAFPGISFESHPQLGGEVTIDTAALKREIEDYQNTLQRYIATTGMTANVLAPQVVDPTPQIQSQIEAICIVLGIPKRIFLGSERGELSSSQDASTWDDRVRHRQNRYLTPRLIVPFIDKLINLGVLPEPKNYNIVWPNLAALTEVEAATVANMKTEAMAKYIQGGVESLIVPIDYLTKVQGFTDDEATSMVEAAEEAIEETELEDAEMMLSEGFEMAPKPGFQNPIEMEQGNGFPPKKAGGFPPKKGSGKPPSKNGDKPKGNKPPFIKNIQEQPEDVANDLELTPEETTLMKTQYMEFIEEDEHADV